MTDELNCGPFCQQTLPIPIPKVKKFKIPVWFLWMVRRDNAEYLIQSLKMIDNVTITSTDEEGMAEVEYHD